MKDQKDQMETIYKIRTTSPTVKRELEERTRILTAMVEIGREINAILDLDLLLPKIAQLLKSVVDYQIFAIFLLEEKTQEFFIRFAIGHSPEVVDHLRIKIGEGLIGSSAAERRVLLVGDVSKDPRYIKAYETVKSELAVPLIAQGRVIGVLDIESPKPHFFSSYHSHVFELLGSQIATAIENARLYERTRKQAEMLSTLNSISEQMIAILNLESLLKKVAEVIKQVIDYDMFAIMLVDERQDVLKTRMSFKFDQRTQDKLRVPLGEGLVGAAAAEKRAIRVDNVLQDSRYLSCNSETRSELVIPLIHKDRAIGVLDLESGKQGYFTEEHEWILTLLASQIATAIENARLYERVARQEARMEREMQFAREIQYHLVSDEIPHLEGMEIAAEFKPAHILGGDLYDFLPYDGSKLAIAVGDGSGKGAPAALYSAMTSGIIRTRATRQYSPAEMLVRVNWSLCQRRIEGRYMTLCYAVWDESARTMIISNAGLPKPIFCHEGSAELVEVSGVPLGLFQDVVYDERKLAFAAGDTIVFYSDGISEAMNHEGEEFGTERLLETIKNQCHLDPAALKTILFETVREFAAGSPQRDDQTLVIMKAR
ncbi:MAG: SpoIIE family protein phosphatase [Acidobacteriia bacterium]|nr:SpoIIE family protein phosphatase [Terriglobia bacterium]